jgi:hypothetical protein
MAVVYHGKLIGPNGQVYYCEHNHRTQTAAITCANSSRTRQLAAAEWNRAAIRAAQAAALAKQRAEERAAAQARRIEAQKAAAARRAADQAAAEDAKAAKRAAKLAAMPPQRAWKKMTPEERLLKIAETELGFYGEIISPEAKAVYDARAAKQATGTAPATSNAPPKPGESPKGQAPGAAAPAYVRALDLSLSPMERARAKEQAAADPEQWAKYEAALRAQRAEDDHASLRAGSSGRNTAPARGTRPTGPVPLSAPAPSQPVPIKPAVPPSAAGAAEGKVQRGLDPRPPQAAPATGGKANVGGSREPAGSEPSGGRTGFGGDGLFVVGLDITPGVYRTPGPAGERFASFALLRSTSTRDVAESAIVKGPATITVGPGIKAVHVHGCQQWSRLGDSLDEVIAAAAKHRNNASHD